MALAHRGLKNTGNMEAALSQRGAHFQVASLCTEASGSRSMLARPIRLRATMLTLCPAAVRALAIFSTRTSQGYSSSQTWQIERFGPGARCSEVSFPAVAEGVVIRSEGRTGQKCTCASSVPARGPPKPRALGD